MAWIKLDDRYMDHPKFLVLSANAFRLWHEGMAFCRRHLTDGLISREAIRGFRYARRDAVTELLTPVGVEWAPLWEPHDIGFKVHDYLAWNDCKEVENKKRADSKSRAKNYRDNHTSRTPSRDSSRVINDSRDDGRAQNVRLGSSSSSSSSGSELEGEPERKPKRSHHGHAFCPADGEDGFCVPEFLHRDLATMLGARGDGFDLLQWYVDTDLVRRQERPTVDQPLDWWRNELRATMRAKGWTRDKNAPRPMPVPAAWTCPHDPKCSHPTPCHTKSTLENARKSRQA